MQSGYCLLAGDFAAVKYKKPIKSRQIDLGGSDPLQNISLVAYKKARRTAGGLPAFASRQWGGGGQAFMLVI